MHHSALFRSQRSSEEFVKREEAPVRGYLVYQPGHAPPQECRGSALLQNGRGAGRDRSPVRRRARRLQPRLQHVHRVGEEAADAARGPSRDHVAHPPIARIVRAPPIHPVLLDEFVRKEGEHRIRYVPDHLDGNTA